MASLRERFRVAWDDGQPVEVGTTVADLIEAVDAVAARGYTNNRVALETSLIHAALVRSGCGPPAYDQWIELLDSYERVAEAEAPGPTRPDPLPTEPSSSPPSPEPTGEVGSAPTPETSPTPAP